jgi:hypothetical protein
MIIGAHNVVYSTNPDADRDFLRDVLKLGGVDAGGGFMIFGLPPAEIAMHEGPNNSVHELYLMADDIKGFVGEMTGHGLSCTAVEDTGWGLVTKLTLPGGGTLSVYQPKHPRPKPAASAAPRTVKKAPKKKAAKKPAKKSAKKAAKPKAKAKKRGR